MSINGDVAEQMMKFYLEGCEVVVKASGKGAERAIALILNILKDREQTKGKARLNTMLKLGKPLSIFCIKRDDLKKFSKEAKKYGVLYSVLIDKNNNDAMVDIMVREEDSIKINRIIEKFNLTRTNETKTENEKDIKEKNRVIVNSKNFQSGKTADPLLKPYSRYLKDHNINSKRKSVKKEMKKIKLEMGKEKNLENALSRKKLKRNKEKINNLHI